jgi:hypothetical protein
VPCPCSAALTYALDGKASLRCSDGHQSQQADQPHQLVLSFCSSIRLGTTTTQPADAARICSRVGVMTSRLVDVAIVVALRSVEEQAGSTAVDRPSTPAGASGSRA